MLENSAKHGILLVNLGTPDSPKVSDVRKYLTEFLNDPKVIDIPWLARKILVNLIIVPFRASKSAVIYEKLWDKKGSPLLYHTESLSKKLQVKIEGEASVYFAMRYGNPSMKSVLEEMQAQYFEKITIVPLYPQYASSTTGSTIEKALSITKNWVKSPKIEFVEQFYNYPKFIEAIVQQAKAFNLADYDHIIFSYHGLPMRHLDKGHQEKNACKKYNCQTEINEHNKNCYQATCFKTTRL